jgi:hypothetical protein
MRKGWDYVYYVYLLYVLCVYIHNNPLLEAKMWLWFSRYCQRVALVFGSAAMGAELIAYEVVRP